MTSTQRLRSAQKYTSHLCGPEADSCWGDRRGANAGSDYLFVPDGNIDTVKDAVASLQSRLQFGGSS